MNGRSPEVLLERDDSLPLVHAGVSIRAGATEDPPGLEGLTRLAGRLMRRTAAGRAADEVDERIDRMGASLGLDVGHGSLSLSGSVLERSFDDFAALLAEIVTAPGLGEDELERLKRETLAELTEILDSDQQLAQRWFLRSLFQGHVYGRTVLGNRGSLAAMRREDVVRHVARLFHRDNLVFGFAGAIDRERAERAAERIHGALPNGGGSAPVPPEPIQAGGRRLVFVDKPERTQTQILIGGIGTHPRDPDHFALLVANTVFGGTFTARLTHEVRAKRGWSYGAYSSLGYDKRRQAFSMWTFPKAEDAAPCIELELQLLEDFWRNGIREDELDWAKRYLVQSQAFATDTAQKRVGMVLDEILNDLPEGFHRDFASQIQAVSVEAANAAIQRRISLEHLLVVVVGTESAIGAGVRRAIPGLAEERVIPFDAD